MPSNQLDIPKDLRKEYEEAKLGLPFFENWTDDYVVRLIERIATAEAKNAALEADIKSLKFGIDYELNDIVREVFASRAQETEK